MNKTADIATQVRRDIVRMVHGVQSGHPGGSLGCTDFLTALYFGAMKHDPNLAWMVEEKICFF
jgi:transketolase